MRIDLIGVGHRFDAGPLLFDGITEVFQPGDLVAITGPSGSGKSTLLSILAGWLAPSRGEVRLDADAVTAWVFQHPYGVSQRSALDHVVLPLLAQGMRRVQAEPKARALLAEFDLAGVADREYSKLSGGEGQRLMLARALARSADLVLVDEPTAQLDHAAATSVIAVLGALAGRGTAVVVATHDDRVRQRCPRVLDLATYAGVL
jgi:ABC-type lipoprotein export system ATPase subunit